MFCECVQCGDANFDRFARFLFSTVEFCLLENYILGLHEMSFEFVLDNFIFSGVFLRQYHKHVHPVERAKKHSREQKRWSESQKFCEVESEGPSTPCKTKEAEERSNKAKRKQRQ